ncbi:hypothetical protein SPARK1531C2_05487 [Klebsiella grimontii]|nr:hypothetical protein SPARK1531C2_05487 [Klebsiella grimontii]
MESNLMKKEIIDMLSHYLNTITNVEEKVELLNEIKILLHHHSPFNDEPVDCVIWVKHDNIIANNYNPNAMAPAEKRLLRHSIKKDGFTQPLVTLKCKPEYILIDGYHRYIVSKKHMKSRLHGYLPVVMVNKNIQDSAKQMAMTIRHNRARGKHAIAEMSVIVRDLARLGWNDSRISEELGMDADEVLRLKQLSGLAELFSNEDFSEAWTVSDEGNSFI